MKFRSFFLFLFDFYLTFINIFFTEIAKKRDYLTCRMTWQVGPSGTLTWHAGTPRGCDVALRPRGRAAGGPREAQEAHRAQTHGRGPRVSTGPRRRPCGAPRGRCGRQMEGPRVSGRWLGIGGGNANALPHPTI